MWRITGDRPVGRRLRWPVVTLGVFDGVHRGHKAVLAEVVRRARRRCGEAIAITFDRHPRTLLHNACTPLITSLEHRLMLLERLGLDGVWVLPFDERLASVPAAQFVEHFLIEGLGARCVVLGFNSRFGRGAEGDIELLRRYEGAGRFEVVRGRAVYYRGQPISSTAIRRAIAEGRLGEARRMLGRRVSVLGTVVHGDGRGRALGFPTANLDLHHEAAPPAGVYVSRALLKGQWLASVTSIGPRPTFDADTRVASVEVHLIDWEGDLYGQNIEVQFLRRLRAQRRFGTEQALSEQIARDVARSRQLFSRLPEEWESQPNVSI